MRNGFITLDILVAVVIINVAFLTLLGISAMSLNFSSSIAKTIQADALIKEEIEAIRSFRDGTDWSLDGLGAVNKGSSYHAFLDTSSNSAKWNLVSGAETVGIFTRSVVFDDVSRDPSTKNIEDNYNPSHNDSDTVKITATVSWQDKTSEVAAFLTNWQK
ncbi:MAG: hypothetical protein HYT35_01770 [Candidatus Staskawiczbacteria bacterium]|nr:hypothetical protein [Candidatus Staskawiczbacteria bacterium]